MGQEMVHKTAKQYVFLFGPGAKHTEGDASMRAVLGLRGANLAEMSRLGIAVPPGLTIATEVCAYFSRHGGQVPAGLMDQVEAAIRKLEIHTGMKFGEARNPLTVAVRCGAGIALPGLMETVLNLGLNDQTVSGLCEQTGSARAGWDGYRLFMERFGAAVMGAEAGLSQADFDAERSKLKDKYGIADDADLSAGHLRELCDIYKRLYFQKTRRPFPQDPREQLRMAITAGLRSWTSGRAEHYRQAHKVAGLLGTAVNVVAMVYGSLDEESGSGIVSSRDGKTGAGRPVGVFRVGAQGIGLSTAAAGLKDVHDMAKEKPAAWKKVYEQLMDVLHRLEGHYRYPQEIEFAVEKGRLWILQTQNAQRTGRAAVRWALEMASGQDAVSGKPLPRVLKVEEALLTLGATDLDTFLFPLFDAAAERQAVLLARGQPLAPGAASGRIVFSLQKAGDLLRKDPAARLILVCRELGEADRAHLRRVQGVLAVGAGGLLAGAVRGQGRVGVAGGADLHLDARARTLSIGGHALGEGAWLSLDGFTGAIYRGEVPCEPAAPAVAIVEGRKAEQKSPSIRMYRQASEWADRFRKMEVRATVLGPRDARAARSLGADGIVYSPGAMLLGKEPLRLIREYFWAEEPAPRRRALDHLQALCRADMEKLFEVAEGRVVCVRLLDVAPGDGLLPRPGELAALARRLGMSVEKARERQKRFLESRPLEGMGGGRLLTGYPDLGAMQAAAIVEAACSQEKRGLKALPEIAIPRIAGAAEFELCARRVRETAVRVLKERKTRLKLAIGAMIDTPRAALTADHLAESAEFFLVDGDELTRNVFGLPRRAMAPASPDSMERKAPLSDPFQALDTGGVGQLIELALRKGRETRPDLACGICGEVCGDPNSVKFCFKVGLNYVSGSPYRVPLARLAAAQAAITQ